MHTSLFPLPTNRDLLPSSSHGEKRKAGSWPKTVAVLVLTVVSDAKFARVISCRLSFVLSAVPREIRIMMIPRHMGDPDAKDDYPATIHPQNHAVVGDTDNKGLYSPHHGDSS